MLQYLLFLDFNSCVFLTYLWSLPIFYIARLIIILIWDWLTFCFTIITHEYSLLWTLLTTPKALLQIQNLISIALIITVVDIMWTIVGQNMVCLCGGKIYILIVITTANLLVLLITFWIFLQLRDLFAVHIILIIYVVSPLPLGYLIRVHLITSLEIVLLLHACDFTHCSIGLPDGKQVLSTVQGEV